METPEDFIQKKEEPELTDELKIVEAELTIEEPELTEAELKFLETLDNWNIVDGDKTLRLNYPLNSKSIVLDLGGYIGDWAALIMCKYNCNIHIFEPINKFYNKIKDRFEFNDKIKLHHFGLSSYNDNVKIDAEKADSTSIFFINEDETKNELIELKSIIDFLNNNKLFSIDLLKLNIEGSEYDVLESLIQSGLIKNIKHIQVQFHNINDKSVSRRNKIREFLSETHNETYNFEFIWEGWSIK